MQQESQRSSGLLTCGLQACTCMTRVGTVPRIGTGRTVSVAFAAAVEHDSCNYTTRMTGVRKSRSLTSVKCGTQFASCGAARTTGPAVFASLTLESWVTLSGPQRNVSWLQRGTRRGYSSWHDCFVTHQAARTPESLPRQHSLGC